MECGAPLDDTTTAARFAATTGAVGVAIAWWHVRSAPGMDPATYRDHYGSAPISSFLAVLSCFALCAGIPLLEALDISSLCDTRRGSGLVFIGSFGAGLMAPYLRALWRVGRADRWRS